MKREDIFTLGLATALVIGCVPTPELLRRYSSTPATLKSVENREARLSVFVSELSDVTTQPNIFNLGERAQAELIRSIEQNGKDTQGTAQGFLAALGFPIVKPKAVLATIDQTRVKRRIIFSIENASSGPADRLARATIVINELPDRTEFVSWDKFASQYQSVDLGTLRFARTNEFGLGISASPPIANAGIEGTARTTMGVEESVGLKQRLVTFTGSLNPKEARVFQQGAVGIDLTGNVAIDLDIQLPKEPGFSRVMTVSHLYDETGAKRSADKVKLFRQDVLLPTPTDIIAA